MTYDIALSPSELVQVTGYKLPKRQRDALAEMGIPYKVRPNGTPLVIRAHLESQEATKSAKKRTATFEAF